MTDIEKMSYALGMNIAGNITELPIELDFKQVLAAISDVSSGKEPALEIEEYHKNMQSFQQKVQEAARNAAAQAAEANDAGAAGHRSPRVPERAGRRDRRASLCGVAVACSRRRQGRLGTEEQTPVAQCSLAPRGRDASPPSQTNLLDDAAPAPPPGTMYPSPPRAGIHQAEGAAHCHWPPNQAWPGSRGRGHGLGWAGWLAGGGEVARGRTDSTRKERERESEQASERASEQCLSPQTSLHT